MENISAPIRVSLQELVRYSKEFGTAPMRAEYDRISRMGEMRPFKFCAVTHLTRAMGKPYSEVITDLGLEIGLSEKVRASNIETTLKELGRFKSQYGRMPYSDEYDRLARGGINREYFFCSVFALKKHAGNVLSYYDALRFFGLPVPSVKEHGRALEGKLKVLGLEMELEVQITTPSGLRKIDACVSVDGQKVYLEVDGNYHHNILSWYHRQKFKGATQIQSFYSSVKRDLEVEAYCREHLWPLLRVDYDIFMYLDKEEILSLLKRARDSGFHKLWKDPDPSIVEKVSAVLKEYPDASRSQVRKATGIMDIKLVEYEILGYIPQITQNPSWKSF